MAMWSLCFGSCEEFSRIPWVLIPLLDYNCLWPFFSDDREAKHQVSASYWHQCETHDYPILPCHFLQDYVRDMCGHRTVQVFESELLQQAPVDEQEWHTIANRFEERWNFPHTLGAVDGKHIRLKRQNNLGSAFYNYKRNFSILLFVMLDADLPFHYV